MKENYIIEGVVAQFEKSMNGRIYPKYIFEKEVEKLQKEVELKRKNKLRKIKLDSL
ncbi:hypothetical protein M0Q50_03765 [bacterium]|jgi:hypothetical protein|nr:hypothetical protein [bacterium]